MSELTPEEQRALIKEAIKEWLDEQYAKIGKLTVRTLAVAGVGLLLYTMVKLKGWPF